jgi:hypothetical protein
MKIGPPEFDHGPIDQPVAPALGGGERAFGGAAEVGTIGRIQWTGKTGDQKLSVERHLRRASKREKIGAPTIPYVRRFCRAWMNCPRFHFGRGIF